MPILCCPGVKPLSEHAQCETLTGHIFKITAKKKNITKKEKMSALVKAPPPPLPPPS